MSPLLGHQIVHFYPAQAESPSTQISYKKTTAHFTVLKVNFTLVNTRFLLRFARIIFLRQRQRTLRVELALQPLSPESALPAALNVTATGSMTQTRVAALTLSLILRNL